MENKKIKKVRLDVLLVEKKLFASREKAKIAIMEGSVFVNNQKEDKPGTNIKEDADIFIKNDKLKYVSRGGYKLEKAINKFNIDLNDKICMDIGASTGGFTDCMLQNNAKFVYAVDCGTNQLDYKLRTNNKVKSMEKTNARYLNKQDFSKSKISFITIDVSFISVMKILPALYEILIQNGEIVLLIKPQFEAGKNEVNKSGVINDINIHIDVCKKIINFCENLNMQILGFEYSPIKGPAGNIEFLLYVKKISESNLKIDSSIIIEKIKEAHIELK